MLRPHEPMTDAQHETARTILAEINALIARNPVNRSRLGTIRREMVYAVGQHDRLVFSEFWVTWEACFRAEIASAYRFLAIADQRRAA